MSVTTFAAPLCGSAQQRGRRSVLRHLTAGRPVLADNRSRGPVPRGQDREPRGRRGCGMSNRIPSSRGRAASSGNRAPPVGELGCARSMSDSRITSTPLKRFPHSACSALNILGLAKRHFRKASHLGECASASVQPRAAVSCCCAVPLACHC